MGRNLPNFLVVGAAKSGTTSLYHYLKQHPAITLNDGLKESRYFTNLTHENVSEGLGDGSMADHPRSLDEYRALYKNACSSSIGEVSPDYLYFHKEVIPEIKKTLGDVKIIIILRNPVERAFSSYMHLVRDGRELLRFRDGLNAEKDRKEKGYWHIWYYKETGMYFEQVNDYLNNFTNVKIYLFDDFKENPEKLMQDIYEYLGVDRTFRPDTTRKYNQSGEPKNRMLNRFLKQPSRIRSFMRPLFEMLYIYPAVKRIMKHIRIKNSQGISYKKIEIEDFIEKELFEYYKDDVFKLQKLLKRDLSQWMKYDDE